MKMRKIVTVTIMIIAVQTFMNKNQIMIMIKLSETIDESDDPLEKALRMTREVMTNSFI